MVDLGAWNRSKRFCQRTGQDGYDATQEVSIPCRSAGSLKQLALLARPKLIWSGVSIVCGFTDKVAIECCSPGTDVWGSSDSSTFFRFDFS